MEICHVQICKAKTNLSILGRLMVVIATKGASLLEGKHA